MLTLVLLPLFLRFLYFGLPVLSLVYMSLPSQQSLGVVLFASIEQFGFLLDIHIHQHQ